MDREPLAVVSRLREVLEDRGHDGVRVIVGGIVARRDIPRLKKLGGRSGVPSGTRLEDIVAHVSAVAPC